LITYYVYLHFSAACFLVIFFKGQAHLQFSMVES